MLKSANNITFLFYLTFWIEGNNCWLYELQNAFIYLFFNKILSWMHLEVKRFGQFLHQLSLPGSVWVSSGFRVFCWT